MASRDAAAAIATPAPAVHGSDDSLEAPASALALSSWWWWWSSSSSLPSLAFHFLTRSFTCTAPLKFRGGPKSPQSGRRPCGRLLGLGEEGLEGGAAAAAAASPPPAPIMYDSQLRVTQRSSSCSDRSRSPMTASARRSTRGQLLGHEPGQLVVDLVVIVGAADRQRRLPRPPVDVLSAVVGVRQREAHVPEVHVPRMLLLLLVVTALEVAVQRFGGAGVVADVAARGLAPRVTSARLPWRPRVAGRPRVTERTPSPRCGGLRPM